MTWGGTSVAKGPVYKLAVLWVTVLKLTAVSVICCLCCPANAQTVKTPMWMKYLGNGTTSFNCSAGTCNLAGETSYTSFTVAAGAKVLNSGAGPLIIRSTGPCTIAGSVSGNPNAGSPGIPGNGDFGGGGGGGGGGLVAGTAGKNTAVVPGVVIVNGGGPGAAGGGNGGNGNTVVQGQYRMLLSSGGASPGGGALGGNGGSGGGNGGRGGTPVIFICNTIAFTGTIDVTGGNGNSAPATNTGAGGGGGGGYVILAAETFSPNTGTIIVKGGAGGSCSGFTGCGAGGNGGSGFAISMTIQ